MLKIKDVMCKKVITCQENLSVREAVELLQVRHVGSIVVLDDEQKVVGIFTERDVIRLVANQYDLSEPLSKVMSSHVVTATMEASFDEAKRLMLTHKIRHLPITDEAGKLIGLFSLRAFFDEVLGIKTPIPSPS
jgi:CBS domain-containing protein